MSDTPRTDAEESIDSLHWENNHNHSGPTVVPADFARQLERELAAKTAECEVLRSKLPQDSELHPDWSMLEATRASLREHQQLLATANARVGELEFEVGQLRAQNMSLWFHEEDAIIDSARGEK